ncbi:hypothetical protein TREMEDRAFT_56929 [Tremella mesenterica DSM 1558]|uniref:uncharacterized protein n=1 Tax=Tremella mesenterica (strain ATCC 24925 / CBS 8224 / DSM 1558 / NBRC 9311 / NRRL Y-6157 / RJB 2259-6 / UBC 559-6) TaxID=578456 RepID=UPI0003F48CF1|nr:uncharacterized protein TREMEDRAFT_56929 [Tremella mesenterica DSM 1558]EIW69452.1 hypothetical protein TREMEDRAFT_56929 [Tremella mesenterica DSM 1558]
MLPVFGGTISPRPSAWDEFFLDRIPWDFSFAEARRESILGVLMRLPDLDAEVEEEAEAEVDVDVEGNPPIGILGEGTRPGR